MRLIRLHVESFGCLHDLTLDFRDGLNVLCRGNGWGKSTAAALIRVMFYGFLGESRHGELENERRRYRPWNGGGIYGGYLIFEAGGNIYRAVRSFGARPKEDTFALYDERTGLESRDYSSDLGEELFRIDAESFARTVFTGQMDVPTGTTSGIHAKLGGKMMPAGDAGNYTDAQARIRQEMNRLSPDRKTGKINALSREIAELEALLPGEEKFRREEDELARDLAAAREERDELTGKIRALDSAAADLGDRLDAGSGAPADTGRKAGGSGPGLLIGALLAAAAGTALILRFVHDPAAARTLFFIVLAVSGAAAILGAVRWLRGGRREESGERAAGMSRAGCPADLPRELVRVSRDRDSLARQREELDARIREKETALGEVRDRLSEIARARADAAVKREERERLSHRLGVLADTSFYLEKAMQGFSSRYVRPVAEAFARYYRMMTGEEADGFRVDVDLGLKVVSGGTLRDSAALSAGMRDLTGLCMRMALVEAMYPNEKPFVVFDDPFVSLDDEKKLRAAQFLKNVSADRQVIYFTCSRTGR
jgi:DNA repair exonuclease SbcCD ATPase subunit